MKPETSREIEEILRGVPDDEAQYRRYMVRTGWRVEGDCEFLFRSVPHVQSVLDIGAIPPLLAALLREKWDCPMTVFDPNAHLFAPFLESRRIDHQDRDLQSLLKDPCRQRFGLVILCEVVEHLGGDLLRMMKSVAGLVERDGLLYVTTPNLRSISGFYALLLRHSGLASKPTQTVRAQYDRASENHGYLGHVREYTAREIIDLVESLGFKHLESSYQVHPRAETAGRRLIQSLERAIPPLRLFGKHLFRRETGDAP